MAVRPIYLSLSILAVSPSEPISIPEKANTMAEVAAKLLASTESAFFIDAITLFDADVSAFASWDGPMGMSAGLALFRTDEDPADTR